jgi:polyketide synthase PksN
MSCRFPGASNYEEFWDNLQAGRSGIEEVPANRWNWRDYWGDPATEKNKSNSKWGGFLEGVANFDIDFFGLSAREVERMDPQQRLMLELTWSCLEDAGIRPATVSGEHVGVFLGVFNFDYKELQERGGQLSIEAHHSTGTASAIIANRVSYYYNFKGPSVPLDTACSSSLSAIHAAIQSLQLGESKLALAGGINLLLTPTRHISFSKTGMLSPTGSCKTFDDGADGYVRGEGAGLILLKPLEQALADKDPIYGIIKGSAVNHGGKTYSLTYPNPDAQRDVIMAAQQMAGVTPDTIGYIEAHGTGTPKGDPIEFKGLVNAFQSSDPEGSRLNNYCALGSVKTNIGHLEAAAGIAGVIKVLLSMQHQQLPGLLHFQQLNHRISLADTPFYLVTSLIPWEPLITQDNTVLPRRAGVSSFGFGGTNAHVVLEERPVELVPVAGEQQAGKPPYYLVCISAKSTGQLYQKEKELAAWLSNRTSPIELADLCNTLSIGREHFAKRTALIVQSTKDLQEKLAQLANQDEVPGCFRNVSFPKQTTGSSALLGEIEQLISHTLLSNDTSQETYYEKLEVLAELYLKDYLPDWEKPWLGSEGRRIGMPTYPFAKQAFWVPEQEVAIPSVVNPLLGNQQVGTNGPVFTTTLTGQEFYLRDHIVNNKRVLPAVAYLEMVRAAVQAIANNMQPMGNAHWVLENISWNQPIIVTDQPVAVHTNIQQVEKDAFSFRVYGEPGNVLETAPVYSSGAARFKAPAEQAVLNIEQLIAQYTTAPTDKTRCYEVLQTMGFDYGPAHQCLEAVYTSAGRLLALISLPASANNTLSTYTLQPGIMDAALQACLVGGQNDHSTSLYLPFALDSLEIIQATTARMWAVINLPVKGTSAAIKRFDIDLYDHQGQLCVRMQGFTFRLATPAITAKPYLLLTPDWKEQAAAKQPGVQSPARCLVFLYGAPAAAVTTLKQQLPGVQVTALPVLENDMAQQYLEHTIQVFEAIKALLKEKQPGKLLVQVALLQQQEPGVMAGLAGLLKTAAQENPAFMGQVITVTREAALLSSLQENADEGTANRISYREGTRYTSGWKELSPTALSDSMPWKTNGHYLITGGAGGLGMIMAREIASRVNNPLLILTGRSVLDTAKQEQLKELTALGAHAIYRQVDIADRTAVAGLIQYINEQHGGLQGILHCAGIVQDEYIIRKDADSVKQVLSPKVLGVAYLDELTQHLALDHFLLFSSIVGPLGNSGQADYAAANAYLDTFAAWRNTQVAAGKRQGHTLSINWPLWKEGGMQLAPAMEAVLLQQMGMQLLETADGITALYAAMQAGVSQVLVAPGNRQVLEAKYLHIPASNIQEIAPVSELSATTAIEYFTTLLSVTIKRPVAQIDAEAAMEAYGIDSIMVMQMTNQLEGVFGTLPKTLFFEYQNIKELTQYFLDHHAGKLQQLLAPAQPITGEAPTVALPNQPPVFTPVEQPQQTLVPAAAPTSGPLDIAIIGVAGRYPQADNLQQFWDNLQQGKDCITEIPGDRWDYHLYYDADKEQEGKSYSKWGGFINDVDKFDPLFFNISPSEAERMDPQERLFLQCVYETLEDAGYTKQNLAGQKAFGLGNQVGVYVGVMYEEYQLLGAEETMEGRPVALWGLPSSIANRVSYYFDFHGPSMAIDTMCSSSLTAIHLACESIVRGKSELAIAGGVNVSIHPNKYLFLSQGRFVSGKGRCESFGTGGDGYVPGEGVGAVLLKPLAKAIADGDHIYGVIKSTAINHGGKTNGYTVPNPKAQAGVISRAFREAGIDARTLSYLEAHGTGTSLGDPIEILGLSKAMSGYSTDTQFCSIGSVKSNIGHCESAAGIAGITKVLLQLKHQKIVPSLHSTVLNTHIDFTNSPFYVQQGLTNWERPVLTRNGVTNTWPRCAGISSFGAGGANAHIILEEYIPAMSEPAPVQTCSSPFLIPLSATDENRLIAQARQMLAAISLDNTYWNLTDAKLPAMVYTLQVGREHLQARLALLVTSLQDLEDQLRRFINDPQAFRALAKGYDQPVSSWLQGAKIDWAAPYNGQAVQRISLPVYPFKKERYWIGQAGRKQTRSATGDIPVQLHPLLHQNISDLGVQRFRIHFTGQEFYLRDHLVQGRAILPAVAQLEMAREAVQRSVPSFQPGTQQVSLQHIEWTQPLVVGTEGLTVHIELMADEQGVIYFEIVGQVDETGERELYSHGQAIITSLPANNLLVKEDISHLQQTNHKRRLTKEACYEAIHTTGLQYGPSLAGIEEIYVGDQRLLARIALPAIEMKEQDQLVLHPALLDPALQATLCWELTNGGEAIDTYLPFAMEALELYAPIPATAWALITANTTNQPGKRVLNITLLNEEGFTCVRMQDVAFAQPTSGESGGARTTTETLLLLPAWERKDNTDTTNHKPYKKQVVMVCGLPAIDHALIAGMPDVALIRFAAATAAGFSDATIELFEQIKTWLSEKQSILVQVLVPAEGEGQLYAGIAGLLKTVRKEAPQFHFQLIRIGKQDTIAGIRQRLIANEGSLTDQEVRYLDGQRQVLQWKIAEAQTGGKAAHPWREGGVYLLTGGAGGLGLLFAHEIVQQAKGVTLVLTGRSSLDQRKRQELAVLEQAGATIDYRKVDITDRQAVQLLIRSISHEYGSLHGILHSAGVIRDNYLVNKPTAEWQEVLAPKVAGIQYLDLASREVSLDFFVLFSSVTGALGNAGQADYATANAFMDEYAQYRNELVAKGERKGHTLSINWPLWQEGGMQVDRETEHYLYDSFGMTPLATQPGITALYHALSLGQPQVMVIAGNRNRITEKILLPDAPAYQPAGTTALVIDSQTEEAAIQYFKKLLSSVLKLPVDKIRADTAMEEYGIDSVMVMKMTARLEKTFGPLSKTLFFEYRNILDLTKYFLQEHIAQLATVLGLPVSASPVAQQAPASASAAGIVQPMRNRAWPLVKGNSLALPAVKLVKDIDPLDIAIVGVSGKYPQAESLEAFWENLCQGKDCITEIPADRWDYRQWYDADKSKKGKTYSKWGGFLKDVASFDALFFNISPLEAELLDPQERLFLQCVQETIEDAGYNRQGLAANDKGLPANIGVYVGVMYEEYQLYGVQESRKDQGLALFGNPSSIANRISYFYNFDGPSMAVDTMCSSSLTAIHLACQSIQNGECKAAIAGGVNISIHPNKYLLLAQGKFISSKGRCESFGAGGDGYVPAEGVGAVLLKPLAQALQDGDHVYGVIKATAINHGGRTNGYTVPNPQAQAAVISKACKRAGVDPRTISYLEAHGTGTSLGDPIEITGLKKAWQEFTQDKHFCAIGSVKSNIGHPESAAGMAGLTKILLQLKHRQLVPSLHANLLNPHIDFDNSPFIVQQTLSPWQRPVITSNGHTREYLRRAGISSFGAGGANAHLIIEELDESLVPVPVMPAVNEAGDLQEPVLIVLSARNEKRLQLMAARLVQALQKGGYSNLHLPAIAYTLQVGREALDTRLALLVRSIEELNQKLDAFAQHEQVADEVYYGKVERDNGALEALAADEDLREAINKWIERKKYIRLCTFWVKGLQVNWLALYNTSTLASLRRMSLPAYPFEQERYWVPQAPENELLLPTHSITPAAPIVASASTLLLQPIWQEQPLTVAPVAVQYEQHLIFMAGLDSSPWLSALQQGMRGVQVINSYAPNQDIQSSIEVSSLQLFQLIQQLLKERPTQKILIQVVVDAGHATLTGLYALLQTARQENPLITGQLIRITPDISTAGLVTLLQENKLSGKQAAIHYTQQLRYELGWQVSAAGKQSRPLWKEGGRYLITGGAGGLGLIFAKEIVEQLSSGTVVLTGRSPVAGRQALLQPLQGKGVTVLYKQVDITDQTAVAQLIATLQEELGGLDGIIHSAGITHDSYLIHKTVEQWQAVTGPKIAGLVNLDKATQYLPLDFFMVFSSIAGALGNAGQADYTTANAFMDAYVQYRNKLVAVHQRHGHSLSINWPLWQEGGMQIDQAMVAQLERKTGMLPLTTAAALQAFYQAAALGVVQLMVLYGHKNKIQETLLLAFTTRGATAPVDGIVTQAVQYDKATIRKVTIQQLKNIFGQVVKLSPARIDEREDYQAYGLNSVMIVQLNQLLEKVFGDLSKTLFYEYPHLSALADYLVRDHETACMQWGGLNVEATPAVPTIQDNNNKSTVPEPVQVKVSPAQEEAHEPIAIIGLSGRYPQADTLADYWQHLQAGKDCITEIPANRWNMEGFFEADKEKAIEAGQSYSKWGGFLDGFAHFDPLFFNISPREANTMDPQERLFLQACWQAMEDAGYTREQIAKQYEGKVGVFAGVTKTGFELYGPALNKLGENSQLRTSFSSVANRVSFHLNLHGPSMPVDTMCSSSLTAIQEACDHILKGTCSMAFAGGVNLYLHPLNYVGLCAQSFLAADGRCRSFGAGGSGFVPGEGVGVVLLKRLSQAIADGDTIQAVVKGASVNHGGKTSGYTVPNPVLQAALIREAFDKAGVPARAISYIEAHGTGTSLGDPIEITGLSKAFQQDTADTQFCAIGSVKSNIGHLEAAAGIAGITKIILQMKHGLLAPSLHAEQLNTNINFSKTPFSVQRILTAWNRPVWEVAGKQFTAPRIAGISSFGAGGSNAHVVIEEYQPPVESSAFPKEVLTSIPLIVVLSARTANRLKDRATQLLVFINQPGFKKDHRTLLNLVYTLQVGREAMEERWTVRIHTWNELQQKLESLITGQYSNGHAYSNNLQEQWSGGQQVAWQELYTSLKGTSWYPVRMNLPVYNFEPTTYWLPGLLLNQRLVTAPAIPAAAASKEWLLTTEAWVPAEQAKQIDWNKQLQQVAGKQVYIVYEQEQEANQLIALLEKLQQSGGQTFHIHKLSVQQISVQAFNNSKPDIVLLLGPGKTTIPSVHPEEKALQGVYQLTQCLMQAAWDEPVQLYYCYETTDANTRLELTALSGFFRSAMKENPHHVWKSVRLHELQQVAGKYQLLVKEWLGDGVRATDTNHFTAIQYKDGQRYVQELVETTLPAATKPAFRQHGHYIIAGGMGYVGSNLLEILATKHQAHLAILSPGPYDAARKQLCDKWRQAGATIHYHVCDITDTAALQATYAQVKQELGDIHGVINLARKHDSKSIMTKTWDSFYQVSQVKIRGTINLDILTQDEDLDLFMLFASIGAYGARGDADYAYSVAFQNAFASYRNTLQQAGKRRGKAISQCWGPWEEDRLFPESRKKMKALGLDLIRMDTAFPLIEASVYFPHSILGLCCILDKEKVKEVLGMQAAQTDKTFPVHEPTVVNTIQPQTPVHPYESLIIQWEQQKRAGQSITLHLIQQSITVEEMERMDTGLVERVYSLCFDNDSLPAYQPVLETPATTDLLPLLRKAATEVLQTTDIEDAKPLQHYGLDSIMAMRLSTQIAKKLNREVMPKWLIEFPTLQELAQHLADLPQAVV